MELTVPRHARHTTRTIGAIALALHSILASCAAPEVEPQAIVEQHCTSCHGMPRASSFSASQWPTVIQWMNGVLAASNSLQYDADVLAQVSEYYTANSPQVLPTLPPDPAVKTLGFAPHTLAQTPELSVTNVNAVDLTQDGQLDLLVCESTGLRGNAGRVTLYQRGSAPNSEWIPQLLALLPHPAHSEVLDFDGDGDLDIAIAVLGIFGPSESPRGEVTLLINQGELRFTRRTILSNVTRVADVRPGDFNGDGLIDFAVAEFGHRATGSVGWLEQRADGEFEFHRLMRKGGAIHVPVVDLNADGALDIVALVSQETEEIFVFLGDGKGGFETRSLYAAGMPEFGAAGIELVDLDRDGDLDILLSNGDSADTGARTQTKFRPYHGIQWLENRGNLRFESHALMPLYGAYSATAGDLDGDGDLDVVAGSFFSDLDDPARHSLVWLENDGRQHFTPHSLARIPRSLVTLELADLDEDGRLELVVGGLLMPAYSRTRGAFDTRSPLSLWSRP